MNAEKLAPRDEKGNVLPLKNDALVRFKNKFRLGGMTYLPDRFGVLVRKGTVLPKTAVILDDSYAGPDVPEPKVVIGKGSK